MCFGIRFVSSSQGVSLICQIFVNCSSEVTNPVLTIKVSISLAVAAAPVVAEDEEELEDEFALVGAV